MLLITILSCLTLAQADMKEDIGKARDVMGFPFERLEAGGGVEVVGDDDDDLHAEVVEVPVVEGEEDVRCIGKVKLVEETEWDEVVTCNHSYDQRCHQTFVTRYTPTQEEECEEKFKKVCSIEMEKEPRKEIVEVCSSGLESDCEEEGEEECRTEYRTECTTRQRTHQVEEDVVECHTEEEERCEEVVRGYQTRVECSSWPVDRCSVSRVSVERSKPETSCSSLPTEVCLARGCGLRAGPEVCREVQRTVVSESPVERCELEPVKTCHLVTRLTPSLHPTNTCMAVPKEICSTDRVNPRKIKKPTIKKWCFNQSIWPGYENN